MAESTRLSRHYRNSRVATSGQNSTLWCFWGILSPKFNMKTILRQFCLDIIRFTNFSSPKQISIEMILLCTKVRNQKGKFYIEIMLEISTKYHVTSGIRKTFIKAKKCDKFYIKMKSKFWRLTYRCMLP